MGFLQQRPFKCFLSLGLKCVGRRLLGVGSMANSHLPQEPLAPHSLCNAEVHHTRRAAFCACAGTTIIATFKYC